MLQIFLTGKGPTDLGGSLSGRDISAGEDLQPGPFLLLLVKILRNELSEWRSELIDFNHPQDFCTLISGSELGKISKQNKKISPARPGTKIKKGLTEHFVRAAILAEQAKTPSSDENPSLAVYFHDTDGTNSELKQNPNRQQDLVHAIKAGFAYAEFNGGIAMIPKPTSEAWLICAAKENPFNDCTQLESNLSGNDRSPEKAPKVVLAAALKIDKPTRNDLCDLVDRIDPLQIDMPSFNQFKQDLTEAVRTLGLNY